MRLSFPAALRFTLQFEGGWSDHPRDPGGATMKGVTLATFRAFKGYPATKTELRNISDEDLREIYRRRYWDAVKADELPGGFDACVFDFAVNSGPARASRYAAAIPASLGTFERIKRLCAKRMGFLRALSTFDVFGKGWTRRVVSLEAFCLKLAGASPAVLADEARASAAAGKKAQGGAVATTGGGAAVTQAPGADAVPALVAWGLGAVVLGAVLFLAYQAFRHHQRAAAMRDHILSEA